MENYPWFIFIVVCTKSPVRTAGSAEVQRFPSKINNRMTLHRHPMMLHPVGGPDWPAGHLAGSYSPGTIRDAIKYDLGFAQELSAGGRAQFSPNWSDQNNTIKPNRFFLLSGTAARSLRSVIVARHTIRNKMIDWGVLDLLRYAVRVHTGVWRRADMATLDGIEAKGRF